MGFAFLKQLYLADAASAPASSLSPTEQPDVEGLLGWASVIAFGSSHYRGLLMMVLIQVGLTLEVS